MSEFIIPKIEFLLPKKIETYLYTLSQIYKKENERMLQKILVNSSYYVHEDFIRYNDVEKENIGHQLLLYLAEPIYMEIYDEIDNYSTRIQKDLQNFTKAYNIEYIDSVIIESRNDSYDENWREESGISVESNKRIVKENIINRIWGNPNNFNLFLSHKSEFKKESAQLKQDLLFYGISCFVAHEDIEPAKEWQNEIENALFSADALLALMTEKFHESNWTDQEIGIAIGRGIPIISVRLGTDPYGFIGKYQALTIDSESKPYIVACLLIRNCPKMVDVFIDKVEVSTSWEISNSLSVLLPHISELSTQQVERLINAYHSNFEVKRSFGFDGSHPDDYGKGLKLELERITKLEINL
ncbi:MAG: toll/interleukin-1 receptor domain-containing protein [FCB group bacterium]|jgi:hypothetical protein